MTPAFRLDAVYPALAESFRQASAAKRWQAARIASELAASSTNLADQEVVAALDALHAGAPADASLLARLQDLAARFDDQYLQIDQEGNQATKLEALRHFSRARATSALAFALCDDAAQLHEAIYEAIAAMDDPGDLVLAVGIALR
jgi:hypothetical protein